MSVAENIALLAAGASAIAGIFAAAAASRSAASSQAAERAVQNAERRSALRRVSIVASEGVIESDRLQATVSDLLTGYQTLEAFSGSYQNSGIQQKTTSVKARFSTTVEPVEHARLFMNDTISIRDAPMIDIDRIHVRLTGTLLLVRSLRETFDREHAVLESQLTQSRPTSQKGSTCR